MHVPSYPDDARRRRRGPVIAGLISLLAALAGAAQAVEFDEKLAAPLMTDTNVMRSKAQSYIQRFAELQASSPPEALGSRTLAAERFDLAWQIQMAIDTHEPLGDLSALGLKPGDDGSYQLDFNASPQWDPPEELLSAFLPGMDSQLLGTQLISRGFRQEDVTALERYLATHDVRKLSLQASLPLALGFGKVVKKYDKIKRPVTDAVVLSYLYQRARLDAQTKRAWTEGLLSALDAQRARILLAFFSEMRSTGTWMPSDQRAGIADMLRTARLPNFEQLATAEAKGVAP